MFQKLTLMLLACAIISSAGAAVRIKDAAQVETDRDNILVGTGLIVGLAGTGDNMKNSVFTQKGLTNFLEKLGINIQGADLKTKNIAAVTVTAKLPPFARQGSKIDARVSAIGDAKSIKGGMLLPTPLLGADGSVYAVAQGPVIISTFQGAGELVKTKTKAIETSGLVQNGAIVENEIAFKFANLDHIKFSLYNPDFSTALAMAEAINSNIPGNTAIALDAGTVEVTVPNYRKANIVEFVANIEKIEISTDSKARIVIEEATGTLVMGENIKIAPVAVAQGNLMVSIGQQQAAIKYNPDNDPVRGTEIKHITNTNLKDLVQALNNLGVWPRDIITILQNIKAAGALQADIEVR